MKIQQSQCEGFKRYSFKYNDYSVGIHVNTNRANLHKMHPARTLLHTEEGTWQHETWVNPDMMEQTGDFWLMALTDGAIESYLKN